MNFLTNNETRSPYDIVKQLLEFYLNQLELGLIVYSAHRDY